MARLGKSYIGNLYKEVNNELSMNYSEYMLILVKHLLPIKGVRCFLLLFDIMGSDPYSDIQNVLYI